MSFGKIQRHIMWKASAVISLLAGGLFFPAKESESSAAQIYISPVLISSFLGFSLLRIRERARTGLLWRIWSPH